MVFDGLLLAAPNGCCAIDLQESDQIAYCVTRVLTFLKSSAGAMQDLTLGALNHVVNA